MTARRTQRARMQIGLMLVAASVLTAPAARAELNLQWDAPPGCPSGSEVLNRIRSLAGSSLDKTEGLSAEGRITPANGRFHLTLLVRDGSDVRKRVISSDSCADLAGAAAISLALLLGIDVSGAAPPAETSAPDQNPKPSTSGEEKRTSQEKRDAEARRARTNEADKRVPPPNPEPRRWDLLLRAPILAADLGPLPDPSLGGGLGVGVRYESWRVLVAGYVYLEQTTSSDTGDELGTGADLDRLTGRLELCRGWRSADFEIAPCLGVGLEHLTARGFGQSVSSESERALWAAPSAGVFVHWYALKSLALFAGATGYVELARPRLVIEGLGEVRKLAPVAAGATLGLEWIL